MLYRKSGLALFRILRYYGSQIAVRPFKNKNKNHSIEELSPETTVELIQPFYCADNLSNILVNPVESVRSRESIEKRLQRHKIKLQPYIVHHIVDAVVFSDHVFCNKSHHITDSSPPLHFEGLLNPKELPCAALAHTHFASLYWGHWISFELPTQMILGERAPLISTRITAKYKDESKWRDLLEAREIAAAQGYLVEKLMLATGTSETIACIRSHMKIRGLLGTGRSGRKKRIFLVRPSGGNSRVMSNQADLISALTRQGYETIDPSKLDFETFISLCRDAEEIIGIEGSHLISTMYLIRRDGLAVVLQPPGRVGFNHNDACHFLGIATAIFVGTSSEEYGISFSINIEEFLPFLDQARIWRSNNQQRLVDYSGSICENSD